MALEREGEVERGGEVETGVHHRSRPCLDEIIAGRPVSLTLA